MAARQAGWLQLGHRHRAAVPPIGRSTCLHSKGKPSSAPPRACLGTQERAGQAAREVRPTWAATVPSQPCPLQGRGWARLGHGGGQGPTARTAALLGTVVCVPGVPPGAGLAHSPAVKLQRLPATPNALGTPSFPPIYNVPSSVSLEGLHGNQQPSALNSLLPHLPRPRGELSYLSQLFQNDL